jgi:hypothetical protein
MAALERWRADANFGLGPTKIRAPHEQRQRAEHGLPGENQHGAMVPSAHHASPTACVAGSSPPSTFPACPQPRCDPRPCIPRLSMAVVRHATSRSLSSFCAGMVSSHTEMITSHNHAAGATSSTSSPYQSRCAATVRITSAYAACVGCLQQCILTVRSRLGAA